jgi:ribonucleoside-triphosphate reductase
MVRFVKKRDGKIDKFDPDRIKKVISKAAGSVGYGDSVTEVISSSVMDKLNKKFSISIPSIADIEAVILDTSSEKGFQNIAKAYRDYRDKRAEARKVLAVATKQDGNDSTDKALLIESDSKEIIGTWNREKIVEQLEEEADLAIELARDISKIVENIVVDMYLRGVRKLSTTDIRTIVDLILRQQGLESQRKKQALLGLPSADLELILFRRSLENSNVATNNPESLNLEIAERIQKQYALENIFSPAVAEAHLKGRIHLHDLGYPARVYCSSHSLEYIKKYGLNQLLANLEAKSNPPNSAVVLNQHVQTFLASLQAHYAGALGFGFLNIFYAPLINRPVDVVKLRFNGTELSLEKRDFEKLKEQGNFENAEIISYKKELRELSDKETKQIAQNLIFAASQNAFSRGGQTLFIDFNIHTGVPDYLKNVPALGPGGKYMILMPDNSVEIVNSVPRFSNLDDIDDVRNGDADSSQLKQGKILVYGNFEKQVQKFAKILIQIWREGDKYGRPFHFPKCDLHVDKNSFEDKEQLELIEFAAQVTAENGSVYFMFDRGKGAVLAQCCRLREKIEDSNLLKYPEKLRFCGFQNVTINLAQTAYRGQDLKGTLREIDTSMELALKAHYQKAAFMQKLLDTEGTPMRSLGKNSDDGSPYLDLKTATYIIGVIGLNEAVQFLTGKQLHEGEEAYRLGLMIIAHMYKKIQEFKAKTGLKFTIEETPAESATRRFAKTDLKLFEQAKGIVKGTAEDPYYTNSIHFAPDADVGLVDRIVGQSKFHDMIESGAIIHAYIGEKRPDKESIKHIIKKTLEDTRCSQLVFSPTYTECDVCGNVMSGEKILCTNAGCKNNNPETVNKNTMFAVTRVVGYYSRIAHWNSSQVQIYKDRKKAEEFYAGKQGRDIGWLHNLNSNGKLILIEFGRKECPNCKILKEQIEKKIQELDLKDKVDFKINYLDESDENMIVEAAMYDVPLDSVPTLVIAGKNNFWKKTTFYAKKCETGSCSLDVAEKEDIIMPEEIELEIKNRIQEFVV